MASNKKIDNQEDETIRTEILPMIDTIMDRTRKEVASISGKNLRRMRDYYKALIDAVTETDADNAADLAADLDATKIEGE